MGIIAILAAVVIVAINPARQFAQARNSQRTSNVFSILNAISQNMTDHQGVFECAAGPIPVTTTTLKIKWGYNIADCIVPTYLPILPHDPSAPGAHVINNNDYDTGYVVSYDLNTNRITVAAPYASQVSELSQNIKAVR